MDVYISSLLLVFYYLIIIIFFIFIIFIIKNTINGLINIQMKKSPINCFLNETYIGFLEMITILLLI